MKLSIVSTLYQSSSYIDEFYKRMVVVAEEITSEYEIIFVNDGSSDDSLKQALNIRDANSKVRVLDLSRNFGHHRAMLAGLDFATGEYIFLIDVDLEEAPELLDTFWEEMQSNSNCDLVYGVQKERKGGLFEKISGAIFYRVFNLMSDIKIPRNFLTVRLMTQRYKNELIKFDERIMQFSVLSELVGFNRRCIEVTKSSKGSSTYKLSKKITYLTDAIVSCSVKPLIWIFRIGIIITLFSLFLVIKVVFLRIFQENGVDGWASLIVSIWLIGGILMASLGTVGIYISKIFTEVKKRPLVIIKNLY